GPEGIAENVAKNVGLLAVLARPEQGIENLGRGRRGSRSGKFNHASCGDFRIGASRPGSGSGEKTVNLTSFAPGRQPFFLAGLTVGKALGDLDHMAARRMREPVPQPPATGAGEQTQLAVRRLQVIQQPD